jgi:hypothetical protein
MAKKANGKARAPAPQKGITKIDAVQQALAELAHMASCAAIQGFVKDRFGIQMSPDHISNCKSELRNKSKQAGKARPAAKQSATPKAAATQPVPRPLAVSQASPAAPRSIRLEDIQAIKGLVLRVGPEQLQALVDLLAR